MKLRFTKSLSALTLLVAGLIVISCGKDDVKNDATAQNAKGIVGLWHATALHEVRGGTTTPRALPAGDPTVVRFENGKANFVTFEGVTVPGSHSDTPTDYVVQGNTVKTMKVTDSTGHTFPELSLDITYMDANKIVLRENLPGGKDANYMTFRRTDANGVDAIARATPRCRRAVGHR